MGCVFFFVFYEILFYVLWPLSSRPWEELDELAAAGLLTIALGITDLDRVGVARKSKFCGIGT